MKKLFSALLIVLFLTTQAWPAAITLTNEEHHNIGDLNIVTGTAAVNSGDTLSIGLGTIMAVLLSPRNTATTKVANLTYGYRITTSATASQTIAINTSADGTTWNFVIIGSGF